MEENIAFAVVNACIKILFAFCIFQVTTTFALSFHQKDKFAIRQQ